MIDTELKQMIERNAKKLGWFCGEFTAPAGDTGWCCADNTDTVICSIYQDVEVGITDSGVMAMLAWLKVATEAVYIDAGVDYSVELVPLDERDSCIYVEHADLATVIITAIDQLPAK